jgi:hypothetical protein
MISTMQKFIIELLKMHPGLSPESFSQDFYRNFSKIKKLEKQKHLQPNFSHYLEDLDNCLRKKGLKPEKQEDRDTPIEPSRTLNTSVGYFDHRSDFIKKTYKKVASPVSPKTRQRDETGSRRESPRFFSRDRHIKVYQDRILKSIIKELSNDI